MGEVTVHQLALVVARHEGMTDTAYVLKQMLDSGNDNYIYIQKVVNEEVINWKTIGPIWEREADNYSTWLCNNFDYECGYALLLTTSKSPLSIARALVDMWHTSEELAQILEEL